MPSTDALRQRLATDLRAAMKRRDTVETATLRDLLAPLDQATAVAVPSGSSGDADALTAAFMSDAQTEVPRRTVTPDDARARFADEARQRRDAAAQYDCLGQSEAADRCRAELAVVARYLDPTD